jgi:hypothetical protein
VRCSDTVGSDRADIYTEEKAGVADGPNFAGGKRVAKATVPSSVTRRKKSRSEVSSNSA